MADNDKDTPSSSASSSAAGSPDKPAKRTRAPRKRVNPITHDSGPASGDDKDAAIAALRAEIDALRNPPKPEPEPEPEDPRDATIRALRAELTAIKAQPGGAESELAKAFAALQAQVAAMQAGTGAVPLPVNTEPDPYLFMLRMACGDLAEAQHPTATHHTCEQHGTVPVESHWLKDPATLAAA